MRVRFFVDNTYEVYDEDTLESLFQGSLTDCLAYIKLKEEGYM